MATEHDKAVLNSLFNPFTPIGESLSQQDDQDFNIEEDKEDEDVKRLELEGVKAAEKGDITQSLLIFTQVIKLAPHRASAFNNRAQAYRLKGDKLAALEDLNNAINLSDGKGKAGRQAFCQRGLIHLLEGSNENAFSDFKMAAQLGSQFAKSQVAQLNPYAAMCNKMLGEMFSKLKNV